MGRKAGHDHPRLFGPVKMRCKSAWTIGANEASMRRMILFIAPLLPRHNRAHAGVRPLGHGAWFGPHVKRGNRAFNLGCAPVP